MIGKLFVVIRSERVVFTFVILVAFIHGLIYLFLLPPWQHYDEPNHFEYSWLLVHRGHLPQDGDYDQDMRRAVARSMIDHAFFRYLDFLPDLAARDKPIWIGSYSQLNDPPLYYLLTAIPLWLFADADVATQLYLARIVSFLLYLFTIVIAWGLVRDLTQPGSSLRWLVPLTIALIPAYADLMTAVNNDVGAVAFFSLFLWGSVRLIQQGLSLWGGLWVLGATLLCLATKFNVYTVLPLLLPVLLFASLRGRWRRLAWGLLLMALVCCILVTFSWKAPAYWYTEINQTHLTRLTNAVAPLGKAILVADSFSEKGFPPSSRFRQLLPTSVSEPLEGQVVTLGAWMWASQPVQVRSPLIHSRVGNLDFSQTWSLSVQPTFYAFTFTMPLGAQGGWVDLAAMTETDVSAQVYIDGVVLVLGDRPLDQVPDFESLDGSRGDWGGPFENALRGSSAERTWLGARPWVDELSMRLLPDRGRLSLILYTLLDWRATSIYYYAAAVHLLRTFWALFGWGHIWLAAGRPYLVLALLTLLGLVGAFSVLFRRRKHLPWAVLTCLGLSVLIVWGMTFVRGSLYLFYQREFYSVARYAYPVIIPTMLLLVTGWAEFGYLLRRRFRLPGWLLISVYGLFFLALDVFSVVSIMYYYH